MEISVDAHLTGVDSSVGFMGTVVGIDVFCGKSLDVDESSLGARRGIIVGVYVLGDNVKMHLKQLAY